MTKRQSKSQPTWTDVKAKLADFDRAALLGLIQSLYTAHKDNQTFLHARFGLGEDVLEPYKKTIDRWLWPDLFRKQDTSVSQAKRAISDYKKAVGDSEGLAEFPASHWRGAPREAETWLQSPAEFAVPIAAQTVWISLRETIPGVRPAKS